MAHSGYTYYDSQFCYYSGYLNVCSIFFSIFLFQKDSSCKPYPTVLASVPGRTQDFKLLHSDTTLMSLQLQDDTTSSCRYFPLTNKDINNALKPGLPHPVLSLPDPAQYPPHL